MESFEPELVRKVYESSDEYSENLQQRLVSSPVFEHAQILQREFLNTRLKDEHFVVAWNAAQETISKLEAEAEVQGVMYQNVSLHGEGILVPKFEVDIAKSITITSLVDKEVQQAQSFEKYLQPDEFHGTFVGFTLRFAEAGEEDAYVPVLAYRVSMAMFNSTHVQTTLFATGDIGTTGIHFDEDEKFEGAIGPLDELFRLCGDKAASINRINMTLAGYEPYDASSMRHVAFHAEKIVNNVPIEKRPAIEDALADLITHYIGRSSSYLLQTKRFSMSPKDESAGRVYFEAGESEVYPLHETCLDVLFLDQEVIKNGEVSYRNRRSIQLVLPAGERFAYVPITELQQFEKQ